MIEVCSGPWAAGVVIVPTYRDLQKPRRRYNRIKKIPKINNRNGKTLSCVLKKLLILYVENDYKNGAGKLSSLEKVSQEIPGIAPATITTTIVVAG